MVEVLACPATNTGFFAWPETPATQRVSVTCPVGMSGSASRECNASGQWEEVQSTCGRNPGDPSPQRV